MYIFQIACKALSGKRDDWASEDELLKVLKPPNIGKISFMWTTTRQNCTFLSQQAINLPIDERKEIYAIDGINVLTTTANALLTNLSPCLKEEADTRLLLHAADAVKKGHRKLCVRTVDTNIVVIAIAMFNQIDPDEL